MGNGYENKLPVHGNRHKETDGCRSGVSYAWRIAASAGVTLQSTRSGEVLKKTGGSVIWKQTNKGQAVICFQSNWSFYRPGSSAVGKSGRNPAGTRGQSRWQSLSRYPGEVTFCQNKGLRLLETAPEMGRNPTGKALERAQRNRPCHTLSSKLQKSTPQVGQS